MKKNTSTARKAPETKTKKKCYTVDAIPAILTSYLSLRENKCPNMTQNMQKVLIPLNTLR